MAKLKKQGRIHHVRLRGLLRRRLHRNEPLFHRSGVTRSGALVVRALDQVQLNHISEDGAKHEDQGCFWQAARS